MSCTAGPNKEVHFAAEGLQVALDGWGCWGGGAIKARTAGVSQGMKNADSAIQHPCVQESPSGH